MNVSKPFMPIATSMPPLSASASAAGTNGTPERKRLLIAEDNPALSGVLKFNLERAGFCVTVANTGRIAFEMAQLEQFDLVITDQQMPEMTGVELSTRLRGQPSYATVPIFMLTAKGLELELSRLQSELGISGLFLKPFSPKDVTQAVTETLARLN